MAFLSPIWLFCLLPWAVLVALLLWRIPKQIDVPFIELWQGANLPRQARSRRLPPVSVMAALLAVLLAILAATGPVLKTRDSHATIILDRGITMSASAGRMDEAITLAAKAGSWDSVEFIPIPSEPIATRDGDWEDIARGLSRTALDTREPLITAIQSRLAHASGPVIVITDQAIPNNDPRLVQIVPSTPLSNVSIVHASARLSPSPAVMIRLRNQSGEKRATIRVDEVDHPIDLPPRDGEKTYFFDLKDSKQMMHVRVEAPDDLAIDDEAWLVRDRTWPAIEPRSPLSPELTRMIEVYVNTRPSAGDSRIVIASSEQELGDDPGVVVSNGFDIAGELSAITHPITANVAAFSPSPGTPGEGWGEGSSSSSSNVAWTPVVVAGGKSIVSFREEDVRQVRVDFISPEFARTPDFVILWTNILDWISQGDSMYTAMPVRQLAPEWMPVKPPAGDYWPGVYRRSDGALLAMNALDVRIEPHLKGDSRSKIDRLHFEGDGARSLSKILLMACFLAIFIAIFSWPRTYSANPPARV
jgi:hypothetical protein